MAEIQAQLARIQLFPIKSLDAVALREARIGPNGGLELDRAWAMFGPNGAWINGKRTFAIHALRAAFAEDLSAVTLSVADGPHAPERSPSFPPATFPFPAGARQAAAWLSDFFGEHVVVHYAPEGFPDDGLAPGPTIVSTASLEAVCAWFPGVTLDSARLRFRTSLELGGVPAFWEDRLFAAEETAVVRFRIGEVLFEGSNPCARCGVPPREPATGEVTHTFQKRFSEARQAALPPWAPAERFDHFYRLAVNTRVPGSERGKLLRLGDAVTV
ncbi:MAG TPA: MOSC N-terminal beta barrel domain-containing protein [Methylomirabilota bacterium]|nr:MOSC N-terminal beta barrel domain-containing protein [Methylomirabilota bacterium]